MKISVLGAGAWGTAISKVLSENNKSVNLFALEEEVVKSINHERLNNLFLKGISLPDNIFATNTYDCFEKADFIFITCPTQFLRVQLEILKRSNICSETIFVLCCKGVENETLKLPSEVFKQYFSANELAILTGPTFAYEVASKKQTGVSIVSDKMATAEKIKNIISTDYFHPHLVDDLIGSQICGAVKNVIAIACGIVRGLDSGENVKAAIITRGFREIAKINRELGGHDETMAQPCGIGDLVLTCNSEKSRNFSFGIKLGQGYDINEVISSENFVVEGVATAKSIKNMMEKLNLNLPLCNFIYKVIEGTEKPENILNLV